MGSSLQHSEHLPHSLLFVIAAAFQSLLQKHHRLVYPPAEKDMANVSKLFFGAAIAAASIVSPALAAHKGKQISAHRNGYVTRSSQRSDVHNSAPTPSCPRLPYCDPATGISYPRGEPGGT